MPSECQLHNNAGLKEIPCRIYLHRVASLAGSGLRETLGIIQFTVAAILIVGSIAIYRQIHYITNKNLGFAKENVIVMQQKGGVNLQQRAFENELMHYPEIKDVQLSHFTLLLHR